METPKPDFTIVSPLDIKTPEGCYQLTMELSKLEELIAETKKAGSDHIHVCVYEYGFTMSPITVPTTPTPSHSVSKIPDQLPVVPPL